MLSIEPVAHLHNEASRAHDKISCVVIIRQHNEHIGHWRKSPLQAYVQIHIFNLRVVL